MKHYLLFFCLISLPLFSTAQNTDPDIAVRLGSMYHYQEDFDMPLTFGAGAEARLGQRFTIGGDITAGADDNNRITHVNPHLRFYPKRAFRGFFVKAGMGYTQVKSKNNGPLGYPFDFDRGSKASYLTPEIGIGFSTLVKDHWTIGFSLSLNSVFDDDLYGAGISSAFQVGYAF
jgi:hypothetical protein